MRFDSLTKLVKRRKSTAAIVVVAESQAIPSMPPMPIPKAVKTPQPRGKKQKITADEMRELRELIRYRYALDVEIWSQRNVKWFSRYVTEEKMRKSDAALAKIERLVIEWDKREYFLSEAEYAKFKEIKTRVLEGGKRNWQRNPPWVDAIVNEKIYFPGV